MKFIITTAAAALLSTSAFAADAVFTYDPVPPIAEVPAFAWSGAYIGLNAGYGGGTFKHPFGLSTSGSSPINGSVDFTASGFLGGAQIGYNWQMDNFIFGAEADFQASGIKGSGKVNATDGTNSLSGEAGTKLDWFGTLRARLGTPVTERMMVYATGGAAYGRTKSFIKGDLGSAPFDYSISKTKWGWTVGAGAEYAVTNNITFKTEYLYTDLGKTNLESWADQTGSIHLDRKVAFHTVRVGLNYKF